MPGGSRRDFAVQIKRHDAFCRQVRGPRTRGGDQDMFAVPDADIPGTTVVQAFVLQKGDGGQDFGPQRIGHEHGP